MDGVSDFYSGPAAGHPAGACPVLKNQARFVSPGFIVTSVGAPIAANPLTGLKPF